MTGTLQHTTTLTITSCWCGISQAIPDSLYREARDNGTSVFCPLGHKWTFTETELDRTKRRLSQMQADSRNGWAAAGAARDQAQAAERTARALRGHLTRLRNRIANGVCPVTGCKRHFDDVQGHITTVHADWLLQHPEALT